jgi:hypothetical protein
VIGDLGHGQPEGVMEHENGPLFRRKPPETSVQLVSVVYGQILVTSRRFVRLEQDDIGPRTAGYAGPRRSRR